MLVASLLILATACGEGRAPEGPQIVYLSGLEQDTFTPSLVPDPGPSASADEIAKVAALLLLAAVIFAFGDGSAGALTDPIDFTVTDAGGATASAITAKV